MLSDNAADVKALKEEVEIQFAPTNQEYFHPKDKVVLEVDVKNVKTLFVKVFKINTLNYYRDNKSEVTTDINLDGLVANQEMEFNYKVLLVASNLLCP